MKKYFSFLMVLLFLISGSALAQEATFKTQGISRPELQRQVKSPQTRGEAQKASPKSTSFSFEDIKFWVGEGENQAALIVDWYFDGETAMVWGYRWNGRATGLDMIKAIANADPNFLLLTQLTNLGNTIAGLGYASPRNKIVLEYDLQGALNDPKVSFNFETPNEFLGQTHCPTDPLGEVNAAIAEGMQTGVIDHPLNYTNYGYACYDYDHWNCEVPDVKWRAAWYTGYWSYLVKDNINDEFGYSGVGATLRVLSNGSCDSWGFQDGWDSWSGVAPREPYLAALPPVAVTGVALNQGTAELIIDETLQLTATISPENASNMNVSWASSNEEIATVDENGLVKAIAAGEATITVKTENGSFTATCTVSVKEPVSFINVPDPVFKSLLLATGIDSNQDGELTEEEALELTSFAASSKNILSIEGIQHFKNLKELKLVDIKIESASLASNQLLEKLHITATKTIKSIELPSEAVLKELWINDSPNIESIDLSKQSELVDLSLLNCTGTKKLDLKSCKKLQILKAGKSGITDLDLSENVSLKSLWISGINLTGTLDLTTLINLQSLSASNIGLESLDLSKNAELVEAWLSYNQLESVDLANSKKLKELYIQGNKLKSLELNNHPEFERLSVKENELEAFRSEGLPKLKSIDCTSNQLKELDLSSNTELEKVYCKGNQLEYLNIQNEKEQSLIRCKGNPLLRICCDASELDQIYDEVDSSSCEIFSDAGSCPGPIVPIVDVTGIELSPSTAELVVDETLQLTATIAPTNATNQNVIWTSSDENIATVSTTGLVKALTAGTASITAKSEDGGFTATCEISITKPVIPVTDISLDEESVEIKVGEILQLNVFITPENATDQSISWSSSNSEVASVDAEGLVTALKEGESNITVKSNDGGHTATCLVKVKHDTANADVNGLDNSIVIDLPSSTITIKSRINTTASIYCIDGRLVQRDAIAAGENRIDISKLPKGIYVLDFAKEPLKFRKP